MLVLVARRGDGKQECAGPPNGALRKITERLPATGVRRTLPRVAKRDAKQRDEGGTRQKWTTAFGWLAGGSLGVVLNFALFRVVGSAYPATLTTFGLFLAGAFGGMWLADRLGPRGFKPLGIAAGVMLALFVSVVLVSYLAPVDPNP